MSDDGPVIVGIDPGNPNTQAVVVKNGVLLVPTVAGKMTVYSEPALVDAPFREFQAVTKSAMAVRFLVDEWRPIVLMMNDVGARYQKTIGAHADSGIIYWYANDERFTYHQVRPGDWIVRLGPGAYQELSDYDFRNMFVVPE